MGCVRSKTRPLLSGGEKKHEPEKITMSLEEELYEVLLDFVIVSANLAKNINSTLKMRQIKEGEKIL